jgi:hypothetical protein
MSHTPEKSVPDCLVGGLRQYRHNYRSDEFLTGFDYKHTVVAVRNLEQQRDELRVERNALQRICARRADCLEALGLHADCTLEEATAKTQGDV